MWLWASLSTAWPCAGISHAEGVLAESDGAEVIFEAQTDAVSVTYAARYEGNAPDFGWVIPVPEAPSSVEDGDIVLFDKYRAQTQPDYQILEGEEDSGGGGCMCGGGAALKGGSDSSEGSNGLQIVAEGFTGTYTWVAIASDDLAALQSWLTDNGWKDLDAEDLGHYVDRGAVFVALTVTPDTAQTSGARELPPVRISYPGEEMMFPSVMARHADVDSQRTTVYVRGQTRATVEGWASEDGSTLHGSTQDDPSAFWDSYLSDLGAQRIFLRSYAGPLDGAFLTRFDTIAPSDVHTEDAIFALEDSTEPVSTLISLDIDEDSSNAALLLLPLTLAGVLRRRAQL